MPHHRYQLVYTIKRGARSTSHEIWMAATSGAPGGRALRGTRIIKDRLPDNVADGAAESTVSCVAIDYKIWQLPVILPYPCLCCFGTICGCRRRVSEGGFPHRGWIGGDVFLDMKPEYT